MKIGDEVYIHGYIDEIRNDVVIIRNEGGYFGTVQSEVKPKTEPLDKDTNVRSKCEHICDTCKHNSKEWYEYPCDSCCRGHNNYEPKIEPQTDEEYINNLPWTEVGNGEQTDICDEYIFVKGSGWCNNCNGKPKGLDALPKKDELQTEMVTDCHRLDEPQTDNGIGCSRCGSRYVCFDRHTPHAVHCNNYGKVTDEPQTDCAWGKGE